MPPTGREAVCARRSGAIALALLAFAATGCDLAVDRDARTHISVHVGRAYTLHVDYERSAPGADVGSRRRESR